VDQVSYSETPKEATVEELDGALVDEIKEAIRALNGLAEVALQHHITLVYGIATRTNEQDELQVVPFLTLRTAVKQLLRPTILIPRR
jgi:hypothetical protein